LKVKIIQKVFRQKWIFIESIPDGEQGVQGLAGEGRRQVAALETLDSNSKNFDHSVEPSSLPLAQFSTWWIWSRFYETVSADVY
jgi:superfamily I DNA and RNA helicase